MSVITNNYNDIKLIVDRFESYLTPWNWTCNMQTATENLKQDLNIAKKYKLYFEINQDCLKGWQLSEQYKTLCGIDLINQADILNVCNNWFDQEEKYYLLKGVQDLTESSNWMKKLFISAQFKKQYPELYDMLYSIYPTLILFIDAVRLTRQYGEQARMKSDAERSR